MENKFRSKADPGWIQADKKTIPPEADRHPFGFSMKTLSQTHKVPSYTYMRKLKICDRKFSENSRFVTEISLWPGSETPATAPICRN
jgi:hypothetical protein